ncbi:unnamed protein product, partial [Ectocarpus sp. 8 AP-2014]
PRRQQQRNGWPTSSEPRQQRPPREKSHRLITSVEGSRRRRWPWRPRQHDASHRRNDNNNNNGNEHTWPPDGRTGRAGVATTAPTQPAKARAVMVLLVAESAAAAGGPSGEQGDGSCLRATRGAASVATGAVTGARPPQRRSFGTSWRLA